MIRINGADLKTSKPSDLTEQLVATTGCGPNELDKLLGGGPHLAARAVRPFLEAEVLPGSELSSAIAADRDALDAIRALYRSANAASGEQKKEAQANG